MPGIHQAWDDQLSHRAKSYKSQLHRNVSRALNNAGSIYGSGDEGEGGQDQD
jgi:hypothetical protein